MAKSMTQALVTMAASDALIDLDRPDLVPAWRDDERSTITVTQLLEMRSGLAFVEDYIDAGISDCIEMLFGAGQADVAAYAAARPLEHPVGSFWSYSSGTTNILSWLVGQAIGGGRAGMEQFIQERLFGALGMSSAVAKFDEAGAFIGSSFVYATARDFARFGLAYARNGAGVVPPEAIDQARRPSAAAVPADEAFGYGSQWWHWDRCGFGEVFGAHGYEGQFVLVWPERDTVIVRLGKSPVELRPALVERLSALLHSVS